MLTVSDSKYFDLEYSNDADTLMSQKNQSIMLEYAKENIVPQIEQDVLEVETDEVEEKLYFLVSCEDKLVLLYASGDTVELVGEFPDDITNAKVLRSICVLSIDGTSSDKILNLCEDKE